MSYIYKNISLLGLLTIRYAKKILKVVGRQLLRPLRTIWAWLRIVFMAADFYGLKSLRTFRSDSRELRREARAAMKRIDEVAGRSKHSKPRIFARYARTALRSYRRVFITAFNTLTPTLALAALLLTIKVFDSVNYALAVIYNGETIGYIADESVYLESRNMALERLSVGLYENDQSQVLDAPKYELALVSINKMSDAAALSDSLIGASDANITNACGIYIDGEFTCSVKNENDARSVFNSILEKAELGENEKVGFVEEISYVQGLYPDDERTMWDAAKLADVLENETKRGQQTVIVKSGDSLERIAEENGLSYARIYEMNPNLSNKTLRVGNEVVISQEVRYVRVKIVRTEQRSEDIPYDTVTSYNSDLFTGDTRVIRKGQNGVEAVTVQVTTVDGVTFSEEVLERRLLMSPVDEKVEKGTRSRSVSSSSGSYSLNVSRKGFVWPAPTAKTITQYYSGKHRALDITTSGASGRPIVAAAAGTVEFAGSAGNSYGQQVVINHGNGVKTRYAHCLSGSISVRAGQKVSAGQQIAKIGNTGNSSGPHLHFEVLVNGGQTNPLNYVSR